MVRWLVAGLVSLSGGVLVAESPSLEPRETPDRDSTAIISLWTSNDILNRGAKVNVWFETAVDAYVTILRLDTDGRVRILFPNRPWHNNYVPSDSRFEVRSPSCDNEECAFVVDDYPGKGYVFAIASASPFEYDDIVRGDYWDYRNIAHGGRVTGDPFLAISRFMNRVVAGSGDDAYSYDVTEYHVENDYEYPRFLCYDCHSFVRFSSWNPYEQRCTRFRLLVHDEPEYSPARAYPNTRLVFTQSHTINPQFVVESRAPGDEFVTFVDGSVAQIPERERRTPGATGRDLGGIGSIPAPLGRRVDGGRRVGRISAPGRSLEPGSTRPRSSTVSRPVPRLQRRTPTRLPDSVRRPSGMPTRQSLPVTRTRTTRPVVPLSLAPIRKPATSTLKSVPPVKPNETPRRRSTRPDSSVTRSN